MKKIIIVFLFLAFIFVPLISKADLTSDYNAQYNALQQQIIDIKTQYYIDLKNIDGTAGFLAQANGLKQKATDEANAKIQQIQLQEQQLYLNYQSALSSQQTQQTQQTQQVQQQTCPANSYNSNGQCVCNNGYVGSGSSCITYNQACQNQYGVNSYGDASNCYCNAGYQWNTSRTGCVAIVCSSNSSLVGSQCFCNNGYIQSGSVCITYNQDCINNFGQNVHGTKGNNNNSSCDCDTGYQWNSQQTACVAIPASVVSNLVPVVSEKVNTTSTEKTIKQDNQNQTNPTQNKIEANKKTEVNSAKPNPSFFAKIFNSVKSFFNSFFK
jgi:hypothetical protein